MSKKTDSSEPMDNILVEKRSRAYEKFNFFNAQTSHLEGKILTIVDASYNDREQREAVKSLMKMELRRWSEWVFDLIVGQEVGGNPTLPDRTYPKSK